MPPNRTKTIATETAWCFALDGAVPEWVHLMPIGVIKARDGRAPWRLDDAAAVVAAVRAHLGVNDLVIDYEHQTDLAAENGQPAPAAGWVKELEARADGIWGRVEWTARAKAMIEAREYRYLSPTFTHDKSTRRVHLLLRAALTNAPALIDLKALAKEDSADMDELVKALCAALGLADGSDAEAVKSAVAALKTRADGSATALATIAKAAGLPETTAADMLATGVETALAKAKKPDPKAIPDPAAYVPRQTYDALALRVNALETGVATATAAEAVDRAVSAGKLTPAQRDWGLAYATQDAAGFAKFVEAQPVIVKPGPQARGAGDPPAAGAALTDEELAVCRAMGLDAEAFKKTRDAKEAR